MQDHAVSLQKKMYEIEKKKDECSKSKMDCTECINRVSPFISRALRNKCFDLVAMLGKNLPPKTHYFALSIGQSLYMIRNYSDSQI